MSRGRTLLYIGKFSTYLVPIKIFSGWTFKICIFVGVKLSISYNFWAHGCLRYERPTCTSVDASQFLVHFLSSTCKRVWSTCKGTCTCLKGFRHCFTACRCHNDLHSCMMPDAIVEYLLSILLWVAASAALCVLCCCNPRPRVQRWQVCFHGTYVIIPCSMLMLSR